ncbi:DUF4097 family beta strand repeat protein [Oscillospiraceae bacterium CM]|nr:DUF4097 family beta strand repeat protein [Oscillospiraceae bacterium CM]
MNRRKIITIICWLITAAVLTGLAIWFVTGNLFGIGTGFKFDFSIGGIEELSGPYSEAGTYTVPTGGVDSLNVSWTAGVVVIKPYDGTDIKLTEYAKRAIKDSEKLTYTINGTTLEVQYNAPGPVVNLPTKKLELFVPSSLADKINYLTVSATSAELEMESLTAATLKITETSGNTVVHDLNAGSAEIRSVSGEIAVTSMTTSALTLNTVSGDMRLDSVTAGALSATTTSGNGQLSGSFQSVETHSVSGDMTVFSSVNPATVSCASTSGEITVKIPAGADLTVSYDSTSGDFSSDIPVRTSDNAPYTFKTVSGDIRLKAA